MGIVNRLHEILKRWNPLLSGEEKERRDRITRIFKADKDLRKTAEGFPSSDFHTPLQIPANAEDSLHYLRAASNGSTPPSHGEQQSVSEDQMAPLPLSEPDIRSSYRAERDTVASLFSTSQAHTAQIEDAIQTLAKTLPVCPAAQRPYVKMVAGWNDLSQLEKGLLFDTNEGLTEWPGCRLYKTDGFTWFYDFRRFRVNLQVYWLQLRRLMFLYRNAPDEIPRNVRDGWRQIWGSGLFDWRSFSKEKQHIGRALQTLCQQAHYGFSSSNWGGAAVVVVRNPIEAHYTFEPNDTNDLWRLHADGSPALLWRDDSALYALNGVIVPQWLALEAPEDISPHRVESIQNAEVRREFLRKVGVERCLEVLEHSTLDKDTTAGYELLAIQTDTGERRFRAMGEAFNDGWEESPEPLPGRRYLKMKNPSIGVWHLEPVHPDCTTIQQALNYRRYGSMDPPEKWNPETLT